MKLMSLEQLEKLMAQPPLQKHLRHWEECKVAYPQVWYTLWLGTVKDYLVRRKDRGNKCTT